MKQSEQDESVQRIAAVIGLKSEMEERYRELHLNVWPRVIDKMKQHHIQNYSIFISELDGRKYLFSYMEYTGQDYQSDIKAISIDSLIQKWWKETLPCQIPIDDCESVWLPLERLFFMQ